MRKHLVFGGVLLLCMLPCMQVWGQPTLEECKEKARAHYPLVKQYGLIEQSEEYSLSNASRAWIPQLSLSAQATFQSDVVKWPDQFDAMLKAMGVDMSGMCKDQYRVQMDLQQLIWDGGKSAADKTLAKEEAEQERMSADVDMYGLESRVEDLYFGILMLGEQQRQIGEMMQRLRSNLDYMDALVENGVAKQVDADAVEMQLLSAMQNLRNAAAQERSYRKMLSLFIGEFVGEEPLAMPEAALPLETVSLRPELSLFDAQVDVLKAREKMAGVAVMPKFALFAQGFYGYPGYNMFENMMSSKWSLNGIVGVKMSWNISAFNTFKNEKRKIGNAIDRVNMQRDIFTFNSNLQMEKDNAEISRLREALMNDDRIVELSGNVRQAAEDALEQGSIDTQSLLDKISDESAAKITRSMHEIELTKAIYNLKHTINR